MTQRTLGVVMLGGAMLCTGGCATKDPNRSLTDAEGEALVKRVRKEQSRPDDLTPAEKKWLKSYLAK